MRSLSPSFLAVVLLALASRGRTQTLDDLVAEALARSPALAAARARAAAAVAAARPAGALPDPMVEASLQNVGLADWSVGAEDMSMVALEWVQAFPDARRRRAERDAALAGAAALARETAAAERALVAGVRAAYARLFALEREREALGGSGELVEQLAATAADRYASGQGDMEAVVKAQIRRTRLGDRVEELTARRRIELAGLARLLGRGDPATLDGLAFAALPALDLPPPPWTQRALGNSPLLAVRRAELDAQRLQGEAVRREGRPTLTAGGGVGYRGQLDPIAMLRFGVELPSRTRRLPRIEAAALDVAAAEARLAEGEVAVAAELAEATAEWERSEALVRRGREALLPQSEATAAAARAAFEAGRGAFATVLDDLDLVLDARLEVARRESDRMLAWARLRALLDPPATPAGATVPAAAPAETAASARVRVDARPRSSSGPYAQELP